jgi:3-oxoacyl-[acyl-carrier-protein] synthase III
MIVLGVASASPSIVVAGDEPREYAVSASSLAARAGVRSKRISLPLDYVRETGNVDPLEGWKVAAATPTSLGVQAVRDLLQRTGVSIEQIGLVLGDTGTPYQTCPSEAQRIVGELGVKTAAFDVVGGIGAVPHFISVVARWSASRIPDYLLYVSTNTPSQHVNYRLDPNSAGLFGDAAVAVLLAKENVAGARSMRVAYSAFRAEAARRSPVVIERSLRVDDRALMSPAQLEQYISDEMQLLKRFDPSITETAMFVAPQLYSADAEGVLGSHGVSAHRVVSGVADIGFSLGSAHGVALAKVWDDVEPGRAVVLMHCGDGQCGSVVLVGL